MSGPWNAECVCEALQRASGKKIELTLDRSGTWESLLFQMSSGYPLLVERWLGDTSKMACHGSWFGGEQKVIVRVDLTDLRPEYLKQVVELVLTSTKAIRPLS
jgi:hypothetical protein